MCEPAGRTAARSLLLFRRAAAPTAMPPGVLCDASHWHCTCRQHCTCKHQTDCEAEADGQHQGHQANDGLCPEVEVAPVERWFAGSTSRWGRGGCQAPQASSSLATSGGRTGRMPARHSRKAPPDAQCGAAPVGVPALGVGPHHHRGHRLGPQRGGQQRGRRGGEGLGHNAAGLSHEKDLREGGGRSPSGDGRR
jgi:hypothetical protein